MNLFSRYKSDYTTNRFITTAILAILLMTSLSFGNSEQRKWPEKIDFFELDILDQVYTVKGTELRKYNADGALQYTYSNLLMGNITSIDVSDPMRILVFYQANRKMVFLDNTLSATLSPVDFNFLGYPEANMVCTSFDNSFWIYDPVTHQIIRFDRYLKPVDQSGNLGQVTGINCIPQSIIERNNHVYIVDYQQGVFVFDRYGAYLRRLPFSEIVDFYVRSEQMQIIAHNQGLMVDIRGLKVDTFDLPTAGVNKFRFNSLTAFFSTQSGDLYQTNPIK
jgi:hypothetical protein